MVCLFISIKKAQPCTDAFREITIWNHVEASCLHREMGFLGLTCQGVPLAQSRVRMEVTVNVFCVSSGSSPQCDEAKGSIHGETAESPQNSVDSLWFIPGSLGALKVFVHSWNIESIQRCFCGWFTLFSVDFFIIKTCKLGHGQYVIFSLDT